jgi:hypothetical protein
MPLSVAGPTVPVFYKSADSEFDTNQTHGVYEPADDSVVIYTGESVEDEKAVDVTLRPNSKRGFWATYDAFGLGVAVDQIGV